MEEAEDKRSRGKEIIIWIGGMLLVLLSGIAGTLLLCLASGRALELTMWSLVVGIDAFALTSIGFFASEGKVAAVYELFCSISFLCVWMQIIMIFC